MVLYQRKPVRAKQPSKIDGHAEVWFIRPTGEIFSSYEEYLKRMDFYYQKRFICEISGRSGLNFFEALESETTGAREVEQAFPEPLKGPVLRSVQFSTVSRIDVLVDQVYQQFRHDYFPGEHVTIIADKADKMHGVVREKSRFGAKVQPDGSVVAPYSRYIVHLDNDEDDMMVEEDDLCRDRKVFTKSVIRSFIKNSVTREAWNGAPWLVKESVAAHYGIDTRVPVELQLQYVLQERRQQQALKKAEQMQANSSNMSFSDVAKPIKSAKAKGQSTVKPASDPKKAAVQAVIPVAPPPKYPIDDLQVPPRNWAPRPPLKFWCRDSPVVVNDAGESVPKTNVLPERVGQLLETWLTLNVYCEVFKLDSFTFDDYVEALEIANENLEVQLFDEIHCSILKVLVNEQGSTEVALPDIVEDHDEEMEDSKQKQPTPEPETKITTRTTRRSLAKLEAEKIAAEAAAAEKAKQEAESLSNTHRAAEFFREFNWIAEVSKRNFRNGGWEAAVAGLLYQLSFSERKAEQCNKILCLLLPATVKPTVQSISSQYSKLDINCRVQVLQIICMLTMDTRSVRAYMEECSATMTGYRKEKIEWQRQRKEAIEEMKTLWEQRRKLTASSQTQSGASNPTVQDMKEEDIKHEESSNECSPSPDSEEEVHRGRNLRRGRSRVTSRKPGEEPARPGKSKGKGKIKEQVKQTKEEKALAKIDKELQKQEELIKKCEEEVATLENDLREADCPRIRVLGKDRFWNRYYWFERNGMPYGGLPQCSTAHANYANGLLWVQGPDDMEREGYIDLPAQLQNEYRAQFGMTVPERKRMEEGATSLRNADQWGFYDDPDEVEQLVMWLDGRGTNELKLRKELVSFQMRIVENMRNRRAYLRIGNSRDDTKNGGETEAPDLAAGEPSETEGREERSATPPLSPPAKSRGKGRRKNAKTQQLKKEPTPKPDPAISYRSLAWENTMALDELGHLHMDPPPPPKKKQRRNK